MSNARPPQATYLGDEHVIDVLANPWGEPLVASTATTAFSLGVSDLEAVAPPQPFQSPAFNPYMASHAMQPLAPPSSLAAEAAPWPSTPPQAQVMFDTLPFRPSTAPKGRASGCASWCRLAPLSSNQRSTLLIIGLQLLISLLAWSVFSVGVYLLYPFQLISVLFHELGHATMVRFLCAPSPFMYLTLTRVLFLLGLAYRWSCTIHPSGRPCGWPHKVLRRLSMSRPTCWLSRQRLYGCRHVILRLFLSCLPFSLLLS